MRHTEILKLNVYCNKIGVNTTVEKLYDGYTIRFNNGDGFVQHSWSYGHDEGCVEPAIGCRLDYRAVTLKEAKRLIKYHKDRLNTERTNDKTENRTN